MLIYCLILLSITQGLRLRLKDRNCRLKLVLNREIDFKNSKVMYNIKGPSKIVAKTTRRGISQNIDSYRDVSKNKSVDTNDNEILNGPKPTFQNNSKRFVVHNSRQQDIITPQHEEIIKYIHDSWSSIYSNAEDEQLNLNAINSDSAVVHYKDEPCQHLHDFIPFDLEAWWGKRLYNIITNSANVKN